MANFHLFLNSAFHCLAHDFNFFFFPFFSNYFPRQLTIRFYSFILSAIWFGLISFSKPKCQIISSTLITYSISKQCECHFLILFNPLINKDKFYLNQTQLVETKIDGWLTKIIQKVDGEWDAVIFFAWKWVGAISLLARSYSDTFGYLGENFLVQLYNYCQPSD